MCVTLADPSDFHRMRISDADRDRAASILSNALAEGRLTPDEHSQRLDAIYAAKTAADLAPVLSDIPAAQTPASVPAGRPERLVSIFSGSSRKGVWQVPAQMEAINVFGGAELDLREAVLPAREVRLRAICVFGGMDIAVPPEMHVVDSGWAIMGGREMPPDTEQSARPDAPVLRLSGLTVFGGISVRRKRRKSDRLTPE
jgi:uncharacterized protein DUF1707